MLAICSSWVTPIFPLDFNNYLSIIFDITIQPVYVSHHTERYSIIWCISFSQEEMIYDWKQNITNPINLWNFQGAYRRRYKEYPGKLPKAKIKRRGYLDIHGTYQQGIWGNLYPVNIFGKCKHTSYRNKGAFIDNWQSGVF